MVGDQLLEQGYCTTCRASKKFVGTIKENKNRVFAEGPCFTCGTTMARILWRKLNG